MKRIKNCVKDALELAATLPLLIVLLLILRSVNKAVCNKGGERSERLARADAATEQAKAVSRGIERAAFEEMQRSVLLLHRRVGEVRHSVEEMGKRVEELERRGHPAANAVLAGGVSSLKSRVGKLEDEVSEGQSDNELLHDGIDALRERVAELEEKGG